MGDPSTSWQTNAAQNKQGKTNYSSQLDQI